MTTPRRDDKQEPWAAWVQENPRLHSVRDGLCCTNSDLWVHRYATKPDKVGTRELQHLMLIEVNTFGAVMDERSQGDTYHLIDQVMRRDRGKRGRYYKRRTGEKRWVRCWGVHYIRMSGDTPPNSEWLTWDGKEVTVLQLEELLRFERDPDTLKPRSDRRHHRPSQGMLLQVQADI
jgi:hypothetical protein